MRLMKDALDAADLHPHLIAQPLAYLTPDAKQQGYIDLPEFPFALEPRLCTRWDMHKFARAAYELGVRYIGGCCGFEAYHIRALAEELQEFVYFSTKNDVFLIISVDWEEENQRSNRMWCRTLHQERGRPLPAACEKHLPWGGCLSMHTKPWVRARAGRDYWEALKPASGRPYNPSMSCPDQWGVVQGSKDLHQTSAASTQQ
ncbi:Homocysteine-binding domain [Trinorchestia longiramus]|nr:Homocysteine-binding domain [Trinorchestia longiramus]